MVNFNITCIDDLIDDPNQISTFVDILRYRALHQSEQVAYIFLEDGETESGRISYQELDRQARAIAVSLSSLVNPGDRALLLYQSGLEFIAAFFGCLYAGIVAVPAYPPKRNQKMSRLQAIIADSQAQVVLTTEKILAKTNGSSNNSQLPVLHWLASDSDVHEKNFDLWQTPFLCKDTLAFLQYTSGSTGTPKGVMVSHENLLHNSECIKQAFELTSKSISVTWLPCFHDMGLIDGILQPLYTGFLGVLMPPVSFLQRPVRWLQAISHYKATHSGGPNFAYELCIKKISQEQQENLDLNLDSWQTAYSGAEPVRRATLEQFAALFQSCGFESRFFYPCYGMAETTLIVSGGEVRDKPIYYPVEKDALKQNRIVRAASERTNSISHIVGCGRSKLDTEIVIVEPESLTLSAPGQVGEILVSSLSVAQGYWRRPEQTEQTFRAYLADTGEGPFLRTGDLGFIDNGELFVTGRVKDVIIIRGCNHYPQDIELTVEQSHSSLRHNCGAAFSAEIDDEEKLVIVQEVKRTDIRKLDANQVIIAIRQAVSEQHGLEVCAVVLIRTASLPKTSSGKVQRSTCRDCFFTNSLNVVADWSNNFWSSAQFQKQPKIELLSQQVQNNEHSAYFERNDSQKQKLDRTSNHSLKDIQNWLVAKTLKESGNIHKINIRQPLSEYGLNSLSIITIAGELQEWLGRPLSPTLLYDYPTIETLAQHLTSDYKVSRKSTSTYANAQTTDEAIAIIGMSCRFPGAKNVDSFWQLLRDGIDAIKEPSQSREDSNTSLHSYLNEVSAHRGGFLEQIDQFDPQFFEISPREAEFMDPQQRLLLEVSWEALENAGQAPECLAGSQTGVFIGISSNGYFQLQNNHSIGDDAYSGTGNAKSIAANRLSYLLDLRGPSWAVDTACSSSLVAVHQACESIYKGESNLALVGGVNLIVNPQLTAAFSKAGMLSVDGRCKTFDIQANGYVRGEGCGVLVLKRLSNAIEDKDNVLAVIRGSAVGQDGRTNGLTAPNGLSQQVVVRQALKNARVAPNQISYVEAHGTGTSLGDPIEINSLKEVLMENRSLEQPCLIGSVKTNIGHLEAAAGVAGLIKVILSLQHKCIFPHLHLKQLNPLISLENTPLMIPTQYQRWPEEKGHRFAGISSFGFGGTNAHVVLEEAPIRGAVKQKNNDRPLHLLTLSAKNEKTLKKVIIGYQDFLASHNNLSIGDICFTANTGRSHFNHRLTTVVESTEQLYEQLKAFNDGQQVDKFIFGKADSTKPPKLAFLFTGQGSQYVGMGHQLYQTQPIFRYNMNRCAEILNSYLDKPLLEVLYTAKEKSSSLDEIIYSQVALFSLEYALSKLWQSWGILPEVIMGYSLGEYVAACIAGVFSLEDAIKLVASKANLIQLLPRNGKMLEVCADEAQVASIIQPYAHKVAFAAVNGSKNVTLSGECQAIKAITNILDASGIRSRVLKISHAFHSPLMRPILDDFGKIASEVAYSIPQIKIISNLTGQSITTEMATPQYWINHVLQPVKFADSMETAKRYDCELFIEIGPEPILSQMGHHFFLKEDVFGLPSLRKGHSDWQQILLSLTTLYLRGVYVDWTGFDQDYLRCRQTLPTYPFERKRYWIDRIQNRYAGSNNSKETKALLQQAVKLLPQLIQALKDCDQDLDTTTSVNNLLRKSEQPSEPQQSTLLHRLEKTHPRERLAFLIDYLQREIATVLHFDLSQVPDADLGFFEMGMDSLLAVELKNRLETSLGCPISTTVAFNYPNIKSLANFLLSVVSGLNYADKSEQDFHDNQDNNLVDKIQHLSDTEAEALIIQKFANFKK